MYSQGNEEATILAYFARKTGRFLDIGAFDGKQFSNTRALVEKGWNGVYVEPNPYCIQALLANAADHPGMTVVQAAVTPCKDGVIRFYTTADAVGTTDVAHYEKWQKTAEYHDFKEFFTPALSVATLLGMFPGPYLFLNIDTEGTSFDILKAMDLAAMGTELVCVEHDGTKVEPMRMWLQDHGFGEPTVTSENVIAWRV